MPCSGVSANPLTIHFRCFGHDVCRHSSGNIMAGKFFLRQPKKIRSVKAQPASLIVHALRRMALCDSTPAPMKQIMLVVILTAATSTFARLGDTQKEFEQANPNFKYVGESPGNEPNTMVRQYAGD